MSATTLHVPLLGSALIKITACALVLLLSACGKDGEASAPDAASMIAAPKALSAVELVVPEDNALTLAKAELGKKLFFDPRLSQDGSMQCQSCHVHAKGWTDGNRFSKKVGGAMNTRNSPTMYYVGYQPHYYWDGRAPTMEKNVMAAWKGHLKGDPEAVAKTLAGIDGYKTAFDAAFDDGVTGDNIVKALTSFVRTLRPADSDYDAGTLSDAAKRGQAIFEQRCQVCHTPPLFTNHNFYNVGVGEKPDVGRGKHDESKMGAFKTPSLRNASKTQPYFHDGSVATLREAVTLMAHGGVDNPNLDPILKGYMEMSKLSDAQIEDLVSFVKALESKESFEKPVLPE